MQSCAEDLRGFGICGIVARHEGVGSVPSRVQLVRAERTTQVQIASQILAPQCDSARDVTREWMVV